MSRRLIAALLWRFVAFVVSRGLVSAWLIRRAHRTPYSELPGYMWRGWLFNAYEDQDGRPLAHREWLPSVRVHHIKRPDLDRHYHDHPWSARTCLMLGWYDEERHADTRGPVPADAVGSFQVEGKLCHAFHRARGYTGRLEVGMFHRISKVSEGGVWTLFITYGKQHSWGFSVNGVKVPSRLYAPHHYDEISEGQV